jgi:hypothetical protein
MSQVVPMGDRFNRNVLFTCLGSPGKPVVDTGRPAAHAGRRPAPALLRRLWGTVSDSEITDQLSALPLSDSVPELVEQALRNGGPKCDNVSVLAMEWEGIENDSTMGIQTTSLGEAVFASTIQASVLGTDVSPDELDDAEIERSIRKSTKRSSGPRSTRRAESPPCAARAACSPRFALQAKRG